MKNRSPQEAECREMCGPFRVIRSIKNRPLGEGRFQGAALTLSLAGVQSREATEARLPPSQAPPLSYREQQMLLREGSGVGLEGPWGHSGR